MNEKKIQFTRRGFLAICFASVAQMADLAVIPAADAIYGAYPDAPVALLNFILSGPQLLIVVSAVLSTLLMRKISKRRLLLVSFTLLTAASCLGCAVDNPLYVAVMRGVVGFFGGFCAPVSLAWIGEVYGDDEEKNSMLVGIFSSVSSVFGLAFSLVAGILCLSGWRSIFKTYWVFIPMLLFMLVSLPKEGKKNASKTSAEKSERAEGTDNAGKADNADNSADMAETEEVGKAVGTETAAGASGIAQSEAPETFGKKIPRGAFLRVLVTSFLMAMLLNVVVYLCSVFVSEREIGSSSFAGAASAVVTLLTAVICVAFGQVYKTLRRYTEPVMFAAAAIAFGLLYFAQGKLLTLIGSGLVGIAYGLLVSYYYVDVSSFVPEEKVSETVPYITAMIGLGSFASSYFAYLLMGILGTDLLGATFPLLGILMAVGAVLNLLLTGLQGRKALS